MVDLVEKVLLFVSTGRTGTKTLANFFKDTFPEVASYHQPAYSRFINVFSNMYLSNLLPESFLRGFIFSFKFPQIAECKSKIYVEANTMNYVVAPFFEALGLELHVVHVIRDPRDWVTSYINWVNGRAYSKIADTVVPFWHVNGYLSGDFSLYDWLKMDDFKKMCWYWSYENRVILDRCNKLVSFQTIKFEDLIIHRDENMFQNIFNRLDMDFDSSYLKYFDKRQNVSNTKFLDKWISWGSNLCKILDCYCSDLMDIYGYGLESEWRERIGN